MHAKGWGKKNPTLIGLHWSQTNDYFLIDYPVVDIMVKEMIFKGGHKSQGSCLRINRMNKHCHDLLHFQSGV